MAVVEGNRGLFDGMDAEGSRSTSRVARIVKSPVILILDCTKATRTVAAQVLGVKRFERGLRLGGVVLNMIAGKRHEAVIREAVERYAGVPVIGAIPRLDEAELPERHMGLTPWQEHPDVKDAIGRSSGIIKKYVDLDRLMRIARAAPPLSAPRAGKGIGRELKMAPLPLRVGVIRDSAFQFYYPENFEELQERGAEIVEVSALSASALPPVDALYIGGGFPETHAIALSKNKPFMRSLKRAVEAGLPVYAECGGLMYLGRSLLLGGRSHPMAGVFPVSFAMHDKPRAHGYTVVKVTGGNPFYKRGTVLRGHEFHYSEGAVPPATELKAGGVGLAFAMKRGMGIAGGRDGLTYKNVLATYTHTHALGTPEWAEGMVRAAGKFRSAQDKGS